MKCIICNKLYKSNRALAQHIRQTHHVTSKEYYDIYLKNPNEGNCMICGKPSIYNGLSAGYSEYCSRQCTDSSATKQNKTKMTFKSKYGTESIFKLKDVHDKGIIAAQSVEAKQKRNTTNLYKYDSINPFGSTDIIRKITKTKSLLGTRSSLEYSIEIALQEHHIKYITDYKDLRYPYHCDFYLPDTDTFIEINNWWMHNNHIYNENCVDDINTLNIWKNKAKSSIQYKRAVDIWQLDAQKYECAINNNLNYIILWNKDDINTFIQNL